MTVKQGIKVARDESNQAANAPTVTSVFMPVVFCRVALMAPVKKRLSTLKTTGVVKKKGMTKSPQPLSRLCRLSRSGRTGKSARIFRITLRQ
ncbi:MAG: hypothetical protein PHI99_00175 [Syntrophales bacterium]|nr:hypothetical protein [Syntrophales bacterium]